MGKQLSGKFVLRMPPALHAELKNAAREARMSLNEYCAFRLSTFPQQENSQLVRLILEKTAAIVGSDLAGLVLFGSWARGDHHANSDIDILVVIKESITLSPRLYRQWDESPLRYNEHVVEPQFVHLPPTNKVVGGIWAEAALDGVVIVEHDLTISRKLMEIRKNIAEGRLERKSVQGHNYWVVKGVA